MAYDPTNTMTMRINKTDNPRGPKLWGVINIEGTEYKVSLWERTKEGETDRWWSGPIEPKEPPASQVAPSQRKAAAAKSADPWDDDLRF